MPVHRPSRLKSRCSLKGVGGHGPDKTDAACGATRLQPQRGARAAARPPRSSSHRWSRPPNVPPGTSNCSNGAAMRRTGTALMPASRSTPCRAMRAREDADTSTHLEREMHESRAHTWRICTQASAITPQALSAPSRAHASERCLSGARRPPHGTPPNNTPQWPAPKTAPRRGPSR